LTKQYSADGHVLYHGDAIDVLKSIETESIDLIGADPPYNIGKDFDGDCIWRKMQKTTRLTPKIFWWKRKRRKTQNLSKKQRSKDLIAHPAR